MSKMNFKSTLWALAFACAAVSCSDDLENGPNNNEGNELNGPTAKINVAISTEMTTKGAGENGDDSNGEKGSENEYTVKDVAIILYKQSETAQPLSWDIKNDCELVAAGWTDQVGVMETGDAETGTPGFPNSKMTTVEVKVKDGTPSLAGEAPGNTYGVIAVTNLGKEKGEALVAKIGATDGYSIVADLDQALYKNKMYVNEAEQKWHVMSTHAITGSVGNSQVTFIADDPEIPAVNVYVERLSAKIRLSEYSDNGFTYTIDATMVEEQTPVRSANQDVIKLTNVAIVNQLTSGSFLLKRVSEEVTGTNDLGTEATTDVIIGDEKVSGIYATNFVIDPWTRSKKLKADGSDVEWPLTYSGASAVQLAYTNRFTTGTYGSLWTSFNTNTVEIDPQNLDDYDDLFLCYTQENTLSMAGSLHGYTTGALFKATYYPGQWMALQEDGSVKAENATYDEGNEEDDSRTATTFYTFTYGGNEYIYENYNAILAYIIAKAGVEGVSYNTFKTVDDQFGTNINKLRGLQDDDPFGYIEAMVVEYDKTQTEPAGTPEYKAIDEYLETYKPAEGDATTAFNQRVKIYSNGVCYYPYWILHAGDGKGTTKHPMEFGIVRNNIYDMTVEKISGLGLSEVDVTDPEDPDKDTSLKIQVNLYVKNWVVRNNNGIIL